MELSGNVVSLHPYFKVHAGRLDEFKAALPAFVTHAAGEGANLFYDFTISGDLVFCREMYSGAAGLFAHLENIGALLGPLMQMAELIRLEVHGPSAELEKLKGPMAHLSPTWFIRLCGVER
jgi:hypothetical protein